VAHWDGLISAIELGRRLVHGCRRKQLFPAAVAGMAHNIGLRKVTGPKSAAISAHPFGAWGHSGEIGQ
jgi:hypothetical protein